MNSAHFRTRNVVNMKIKRKSVYVDLVNLRLSDLFERCSFILDKIALWFVVIVTVIPKR